VIRNRLPRTWPRRWPGGRRLRVRVGPEPAGHLAVLTLIEVWASRAGVVFVTGGGSWRSVVVVR
jgi:hypothetical protein